MLEKPLEFGCIHENKIFFCFFEMRDFFILFFGFFKISEKNQIFLTMGSYLTV